MARRRFTTWWSGVVVARIFLSPAAPQDRPWTWATRHNGDIKRVALGYDSSCDGSLHEELAGSRMKAWMRYEQDSSGSPRLSRCSW
jgi:hypothetical protein